MEKELEKSLHYYDDNGERYYLFAEIKNHFDLHSMAPSTLQRRKNAVVGENQQNCPKEQLSKYREKGLLDRHAKKAPVLTEMQTVALLKDLASKGYLSLKEQDMADSDKAGPSQQEVKMLEDEKF